MYLPFLWLGLLVVFLMVEAATVGVTSVWFAAGSLSALIVSLFPTPFYVQFLVFLVVSGVSLALLRPLVKKYLTPKITPTNVDSIVGSRGIVTEAIDNTAATGQVKLNSLSWSARSTDETPIPLGALVQADRVEGVKVYVSVIVEQEKRR